MKKLPIGIQSFVKLRTNDCLYIDKTNDIHRLITAGNIFFLSRPPPFWKISFSKYLRGNIQS